MIDEAVLDFSAGSLVLLNGILAVVMFSSMPTPCKARPPATRNSM